MRARWPLLIVAALAVGGAFYASRHWAAQHDHPADAPVPVPVSAAAAHTGDVPVDLRGIGTVQALNSVELRPQVGGVLVSVPVQEGQEVAKDTVLAVIDPRPLQAALDKAQAQLKQDQAQLQNAQADLGRYGALAQRDFASRQQLDTQQATVTRLEGVIAADQSEIETAQINLGYSVIRAPFAGRIGLRRVDPGNLLQANSTGPGILSLVQDQPISVVFTLPENELPRVRDAMTRGPLTVFADASDSSRQLGEGRLTTPDNAINTGTGTIQFKSEFPNADLALTPGQFVAVRLRVDTLHGVTIPHEAVQHGQDSLFVFLVKPDKTAEQRTVQLAYDNGTTAMVRQGVAEGDQVVTAGQSRITQGTLLAVGGSPGAAAPPAPAPGQTAAR